MDVFLKKNNAIFVTEYTVRIYEHEPCVSIEYKTPYLNKDGSPKKMRISVQKFAEIMKEYEIVETEGEE